MFFGRSSYVDSVLQDSVVEINRTLRKPAGHIEKTVLDWKPQKVRTTQNYLEEKY